MMYEIATLDRPFDATMMQQLVFKIVNGQLAQCQTNITVQDL